MSLVVRARPQVAPSRRRGLAAVALLVAVLGSLAWGTPGARADQNVVYDGAGGAPWISLVGDSTLSGVRWYADYGALRRFNFVLSAESCRRTVERSCISREGYRPDNVIAAMRSLDGELGEVLVVMTGYNDPVWSIDEAIEGVVDEARAQGVARVVWLSLRASADVDYSDPQRQTSLDTFREYNEQLVDAALASDGYLQVADWATYSLGATRWFEADGVHLTPAGVDALTTFVAGTVEQVLAGADVTPAVAPWTVLVPGAEGEIVTAVQSALIAAGIELPGGADGVYGNDTMAAVAEYQRRDGSLQVTGAVDEATARSLGVHGEPAADEAVAPPTTNGGEVAAPGPVAEASAGAGASAGTGGRTPVWALALALAAVAAVVAVVARRRIVVARRAARRWARVHPSTSPMRSVADLRRAGRMPSTDAAAREGAASGSTTVGG